MDDGPNALHSVFVDWPPGATVDQVEVRYATQMDGVPATWVEVGRVPHHPDIEGLPARIEVLFRRTG